VPSFDGQTIAGCRLVRKIGEGGMGVVYEALEEATNRRAAVKLLHPTISLDREVALRFRNEAQVLKNMEQIPGLVRIFADGELPNGTAYIVMEFLEGKSLKDHLKEAGGIISTALAIEICKQVAEVLATTHQKNVVHRDLKPDNVMLIPDAKARLGYRAKVFDFGIAKLPPEQMNQELTQLRTQDGQILGTPPYMAPEQCINGRKVTDRADVYALATMLYRCLAGRTPFTTDVKGDMGLMHICAMQIAEPPPQLTKLAPHVAPAVAKLVHAALEKEPTARMSMAEFAKALEELQQKGIGEGDKPPVAMKPATPEQAGTLYTPTITSSGAKSASIVLSQRRRNRNLIIGAIGVVWFVALAYWALFH